ncbi:mCG146881 [Mus musculus]|nr:mCG146881 [Mus musculus]
MDGFPPLSQIWNPIRDLLLVPLVVINHSTTKHTYVDRQWLYSLKPDT